MRLSRADLNRTLLARQGLLQRGVLGRGRLRRGAPDLVERLLGLQAQETWSPYLGLAARLQDFDPVTTSDALGRNELLRLVTLRGTIHLHTPADTLSLRPWVHDSFGRARRSSEVTQPGQDIPREEVDAAVTAVLADGPLTFAALGEALTAHFPGTPAKVLAHLARLDSPLVQLPPRGQWRGAGGVVVQRADVLLGRPLAAADPADVVRRYLAAFGPATAADVTTWSGVTGLAPVLKALDLVEHEGPEGRRLLDLPGAEIVPGQTPAPVRLLGTYDNVFLSHHGRDRVTTRESRPVWSGRNGGMAPTVFVDGWLTGLWRIEDGRPVVTTMLRDLSADERRELDAEVNRTSELLAR